MSPSIAALGRLSPFLSLGLQVYSRRVPCARAPDCLLTPKSPSGLEDLLEYGARVQKGRTQSKTVILFCCTFFISFKFFSFFFLCFVFFWPVSMWCLSSLTRNRTHTPCIGRQGLNHCTIREVPVIYFKRTKDYLMTQTMETEK